MGEALFIKGHLFELTPVIAHIECVAAVVWLLGAATVLVLHLVRYYRVEHYIKKHRMPAEKKKALRVVKKLNNTGKVNPEHKNVVTYQKDVEQILTDTESSYTVIPQGDMLLV